MKQAKEATGKISAHSEKGIREANEDRHVYFPNLGELTGKEKLVSEWDIAKLN